MQKTQHGREVTLAKQLWELECEAQEQQATLKKTMELIGAKSDELLDYLVAEGKNSTGHIDGVGVFTLKRENYPSVTQDKMPVFLDYLREIGQEGLIIESVPAATLKKYCKERIETLTETYIADPLAHEQAIAELKITSEEIPSPAMTAKMMLERYGVATFQKIKISHTLRGK